VRVQWYDAGVRRLRSWPNTPDGRADAKAWATGFAEARTFGRSVSPTERLTVRQLWERYIEAEFPHLRPKTQANYTGHWKKWELFLGRHFVAEDVKLGDVDHFRAALERQSHAVSQIHKAITTVKTVFAWGQRREIVGTNRLLLYRFKLAKEARPESPAEYSAAESEAIIAALAPQRAEQWRPWTAVMIAAHQGARMNAILHLQWADVDVIAGELTWRARWDKNGREWRQPLTEPGLSALLTARWWRDRDGYTGPWIFYSSHARKRAIEDERAVYHPTSLERALVLAERRAGVQHQPYRAMHGFRRAVAGDVAHATRDAKLALDYIGDVDLKMARNYLKRRDERLDVAAAVFNDQADPRNRHQTVTESSKPWSPDAEVSGDLALAELGREDSNLQLPG
jgi:integrase